jgi:hypothetical protein
MKKILPFPAGNECLGLGYGILQRTPERKTIHIVY